MFSHRRSAVAAAILILLLTQGFAGCRSHSDGALEAQAAALQPLALSRLAQRQSMTEPANSTVWLSQKPSPDGQDAHVSHQRQRALSWADGLAYGPRLYSVTDAEYAPVVLPADNARTAGNAGADDPLLDDRWWQKPLAGRRASEVFWDDVKLFPRELWKSTKDTATVPGIIILGAAGGLSAISRHNWDDDTYDYFRNNRTAWSREGDFGGFISNPFLHFGLGLAGYAWSLHTQNDEMYGFTKTLLHALTLNSMVTVGLKLAANDTGPNGEPWAWPSGHTSHIVTVAAVVTEYYGPLYGVPAYLLAGWGGVSRISDREHWLSDVIMGFAIGSVVGHSVARGRMVEVGGFTLMPYVPREGGAGVMFVRRW